MRDGLGVDVLLGEQSTIKGPKAVGPKEDTSSDPQALVDFLRGGVEEETETGFIDSFVARCVCVCVCVLAWCALWGVVRASSSISQGRLCVAQCVVHTTQVAVLGTLCYAWRLYVAPCCPHQAGCVWHNMMFTPCRSFRCNSVVFLQLWRAQLG